MNIIKEDEVRKTFLGLTVVNHTTILETGGYVMLLYFISKKHQDQFNLEFYYGISRRLSTQHIDDYKR